MCRLRRVIDWCYAMQEAEEGQESLAVPQVPVLALPGMPGADLVPCPASCLLPIMPTSTRCTVHGIAHTLSKPNPAGADFSMLAHRLALSCRLQGAAMSRVWAASSIRKLYRAHSHLAWTSCSTWRTCRLCWQAPPLQVFRSLSACPGPLFLSSMEGSLHDAIYAICQDMTGCVWPCRTPI